MEPLEDDDNYIDDSELRCLSVQLLRDGSYIAQPGFRGTTNLDNHDAKGKVVHHRNILAHAISYTPGDTARLQSQ